MAIPDVQQFSMQPGGGLATSLEGLNALQQSNVAAQYAPYTAYADAASKIAYANMLPYQIQATVMSNPMLWMAYQKNPEVLQGMLSNFAQSVPRNVMQLPGGGQLPTPGSRGNGLLGMLMNKLSGGQQNAMDQGQPQAGQSSNAMNNIFPATPGYIDSAGGGSVPVMNNQMGAPSADQGSPLVPGSRGGVAGIAGKMTAPYNQQFVDPGKTFYDPATGQVISSPTQRMTTSLQTSINAAQRVAPQLERIANEAAPFMTGFGMGKMQLERAGNYLMGQNNPLPTQYAAFKANLKAAPEALVKSYGLNPTNETIERMADVIEPMTGETGGQYKQRILNTLEQIKQEQISLGQSQLYGGMNVGGAQGGVAPASSGMQGSAQSNAMPGQVSAGSKALAKDMELPSFNSKEEYQQWFSQQPETVRNAVRLHLGNK